MKKDNLESINKDSITQPILDPMEEEEEYTNYRKSLIFTHECPACHYAQGMILLGVGFFTALRMQFIWRSLNYKQIMQNSAITLIASSLGIYKFTYAFHVFQVQGKVKKYKDKEAAINKENSHNSNNLNRNI